MTDDNAKGLLFVVSAPSGGGKGTILERAMRDMPSLVKAVSATTRKPRSEDEDGRQYHFVDRATFDRWVNEGRFAEWAEVHGARYGTLREELDRLRGGGSDVVLELDVQGMRSIRKLEPEAATVFIEPPSLEVLEQRLRARGDLSEEQLALRLKNAKAELAAKNEYDYRIVNDDLGRAVAEFEAFVKRSRERAR